MTIYDIVGDCKALEKLIDEMTDPETGETREFTEGEIAEFTAWADEADANLESKIDAICKVHKNKKAEAGIAEAEKNALAAEIDRLRKRAKAKENEANRVKSLIVWAFDRLKIKKYKTTLFTTYFQAIRKTAKANESFNPDAIPVEFLKRELSPSSVDAAVKEGRLYEKTEDLYRGKLFYRDEKGVEKRLAGVSYLGGETLVIK